MFVSIKFLDLVPVDGKYLIIYSLSDTDFILKLSLSITQSLYNQRAGASIIPGGLVVAYKERQKNIPKNLALFYSTTLQTIPQQKRKELLTTDKIWTDKHYPELEYGDKYFNCVYNQLRVLEFTGQCKNAQYVSGTIL